MTVTETQMTVGTAFGLSLTMSLPDLAVPVHVSVLNVTSQEMQGDYVSIVVDGVEKGKVRIR